MFLSSECIFVFCPCVGNSGCLLESIQCCMYFCPLSVCWSAVFSYLAGTDCPRDDTFPFA